MDIIFVCILTYWAQWFIITGCIGAATGFGDEPECSTAMTWAAIWPYLLVKYICLVIYRLVTYRRRRRAKTIARLEDQHRNYIKGLMDEDDEAYALGFYGEYPPVEMEKAS